MSETPRTDALTGTFYLRCDDCSQPEKCERMKSIHPEDARQLERDLRAAQERLAQLTAPGEYGWVAEVKKAQESRIGDPALNEADATSEEVFNLCIAIEQLQARLAEYKKAVERRWLNDAIFHLDLINAIRPVSPYGSAGEMLEHVFATAIDAAK